MSTTNSFESAVEHMCTSLHSQHEYMPLPTSSSLPCRADSSWLVYGAPSHA
jgi:hypothetical protein